MRWTADKDNAIKPGRTQDFDVRLGPLPEEPQIVFKGLQHYADGQVVRWIPGPGGCRTPGHHPRAERDATRGLGSAPVGFVILGAALVALVGGAVVLLRRRA